MISERFTRECLLSDLRIGLEARVTAVPSEHAAELGSHGIRPGVLLVVEADAPLGGPRIVRVGSARLALARSIAAALLVAW